MLWKKSAHQVVAERLEAIAVYCISDPFSPSHRGSRQIPAILLWWRFLSDGAGAETSPAVITSSLPRICAFLKCRRLGNANTGKDLLTNT